VRARAITAQDPQRVELHFECEILGAAARGVEDLHSHDRRDPEPVGEDRSADERAEFGGKGRDPPPG